MFPQQMFFSRANGETFEETCFLDYVSATMFISFAGAPKARFRFRFSFRVRVRVV